MKIKVKPLEWVNGSAETAIFGYRIGHYSDDSGEGWDAHAEARGNIWLSRDTEAEAKAACEADYEARILSAIEVEE